MKKIRLTEVSEAVRAFLNQVLQGDGVEIEDEDGRTRGQFVPHRDPTADEERRADASLERLRKRTGESMRKHGVTEDDVMEAILEDD